MNSINWSLQQALGISDEEARNAELRASRIEEAHRPDGAREYVPVSEYGLQVQAAKLGVAAHRAKWAGETAKRTKAPPIMVGLFFVTRQLQQFRLSLRP